MTPPSLPATPTRRLALTIAYWGPAFRGFQSQRGGGSVQDTLEEVFTRITGTPCRLHGAGRTDAGVHAEGQVVHFDLAENSRMDARQWREAFNCNLPPTLRVLRVRFRRSPWHARYSAVAKTYRYELCFAPVLLPALRETAWHLYPAPDLPTLQAALDLFPGTHHFQSFSPRKLPPGKSDLRTLHSIKLHPLPGQRLRLDLTGDGFLYKMVRMLVGTAVHAARHKISIADLNHALEHPNPGTFSIVAPAHGLTLNQVFYHRRPSWESINPPE